MFFYDFGSIEPEKTDKECTILKNQAPQNDILGVFHKCFFWNWATYQIYLRLFSVKALAFAALINEQYSAAKIWKEAATSLVQLAQTQLRLN